MERLVFTSQQEAAIEEAKTWLNSQIWFKQRGIPWKRGWLLKGSAGTGKTSMVKAVGQLLDLPVVFFDLASMTNYDCQMAWQRAEGLTPCIVLLEDVDAVFNGRENTISIKYGVFGVTFDCLLNCIDGVINSDGIFLMVTTNYPEKLDTALSGITGNGITTRPGRIDRVIEFGYIGREGKLKIAQRIFAGFPEEVYRELIDDQLLTGAQFQEKCTRLALKLFWKK
jgi:SpoVK/Ycf46/Vps4 family AAA+-type ATPase